MSKIYKRSFIGILVLAILTLALPAFARAKMNEDELIAQLSSSDEKKVYDALQNLEKQYPTSTTDLPAIKKLLTDDRIKVKRKAARVLGVIHADVSESDIAAICTLLKSPDPDTVTDGLKALRGLKAPSAVPEILPVLKNPTPNVVRDACRTLAVLGDKSVVPSLEPLLSSPNPKVQQDAQDAIFALKAKS
ncbi:MAG TPA: HEAT repeat domain-containing protein [Verrucomicrobiae bacterium]